ncbi:MAG TPA: hypothetical protein VFJ04_05995, partial [Rhodanobacteraceae bacterium]|nr:hypothetical protein [Rhodanobacteraceae bacterium]
MRPIDIGMAKPGAPVGSATSGACIGMPVKLASVVLILCGILSVKFADASVKPKPLTCAVDCYMTISGEFHAKDMVLKDPPKKFKMYYIFVKRGLNISTSNDENSKLSTIHKIQIWSLNDSLANVKDGECIEVSGRVMPPIYASDVLYRVMHV